MENPDLLKSLADQRVLTLDEVARITGVATVTIRRAIKAGRGPRVVRPSPRRLGVRVCDLVEWLERRASNAAA
ncbi:MAG TPA: DNA-binding protein [Rhodospirillales bacterium]|nr:DNA-binding protein [Rhodospirillales bacterium]